MRNPISLGEIAYGAWRTLVPTSLPWRQQCAEVRSVWIGVALALLAALDATRCPHCGKPLELAGGPPAPEDEA